MTLHPRAICRWRCAPVSLVRRLANECAKGIDFGGSSKSSIYEAMGQKEYFKVTVDQKRFIDTMDNLEREVTRRMSDMDKACMDIIHQRT